MKEKIVVKLPGNLLRELEQLRDSLKREAKTMYNTWQVRTAAVIAYNHTLGRFFDNKLGHPLRQQEMPELPPFYNTANELLVKIENVLSHAEQLP